MVSEGVDIPRLRVGVFATTTTTELFFRQAVGRLVRCQPDVGRQSAYLFIPDDASLRNSAAQIADDRRHSLRRGESPDGSPSADGEMRNATAHELRRRLLGGNNASAMESRLPHGDEPSEVDPPFEDIIRGISSIDMTLRLPSVAD